jgi:hypothetical protein
MYATVRVPPVGWCEYARLSIVDETTWVTTAGGPRTFVTATSFAQRWSKAPIDEAKRLLC